MSTGSAPHNGRPAQAGIDVRRARPLDAAAATAVLRASIAELCAADHGDDPEIVGRWLANKTPGDVRAWIAAPGRVVVAWERRRIVGVGAALASGEITLNYVLPKARFRGVSKAVLGALEEYLRAQGHARSSLASTRTAHRFYRAAGYVDAGEPRSWGGLTEFPMVKDLSAHARQTGATLPADPADGG